MNRISRQKLVDATLLGLAIASGVAVAVTHRWQTNHPGEESSGALIPVLAEAEPSNLVLERGGKSARISHRDSSGGSSAWMVESPWKRSAESSTVDAAITALRDMQLVRKVQTGPQVTSDELTRFGLSQPAFTWQVQVDNSTWSVAFGADAPQPHGGTYVDVVSPNSSTHQLYVAAVDLPKLAILPEQLVEPRLVSYVPSDFGTLFIESGSNRASFRFDASRSRWFDAEGQHYRISRAAIDSLLMQLTTLKALHFVTPAEAAAKHWAKNLANVTLGLSKAQVTVRLEFGGPCSGEPEASLVTVSGQEQFDVCADTRSLVAKLEVPPAEWIDSRLFSVRPDEVESLEQKLAGQTLKLERWESGFRITERDVQSLDLEKGNRLLGALLKVDGKLSHLPSAASAFDNASYVKVRSAVIGDTDQYEERVVVGPALANGDRYVRREVDGALLRVAGAQAALLVIDAGRLKAASTSVQADAGAE